MGLKKLVQRIFWLCCLFFFIDAKTPAVKEIWTGLVQSVLYLLCNRLVWFSLICVIFTSIKTQNYTHVFGPLRRICTTAYAKFVQKTVDRWTNLSQNRQFWTTYNWNVPVVDIAPHILVPHISVHLSDVCPLSLCPELWIKLVTSLTLPFSWSLTFAGEYNNNALASIESDCRNEFQCYMSQKHLPLSPWKGRNFFMIHFNGGKWWRFIFQFLQGFSKRIYLAVQSTLAPSKCISVLLWGLSKPDAPAWIQSMAGKVFCLWKLDMCGLKRKCIWHRLSWLKQIWWWWTWWRHYWKLISFLLFIYMHILV